MRVVRSKRCNSSAALLTEEESNMLTKRLLIAALLAGGTLGAVATPVASAAATHFQLSHGTPVRHEYQGAHRPGYVRVPGHREWNGHRRVWVPGHWEPRYRGYGHGGYAQYTPRWDRDGDGVPNRRDARPDNPYRY
jgi:hypothetical protein